MGSASFPIYVESHLNKQTIVEENEDSAQIRGSLRLIVIIFTRAKIISLSHIYWQSRSEKQLQSESESEELLPDPISQLYAPFSHLGG